MPCGEKCQKTPLQYYELLKNVKIQIIQDWEIQAKFYIKNTVKLSF